MHGRLVAVIGLVACAGDAGAPDPTPHQLTAHFVLSELSILDTDSPLVIDVDGDGTPDNQLGILAADWSSLFETAIQSGATIIGVQIGDLDSASDDTYIELGVVTGLDEDIPADPGDNFTGSEHFYIAPGSLDGNGRPLIVVPATLVAGTITVAELPGLGPFGLQKGRLRGKLAHDLSAITDGVIAGVLPVSRLADTPPMAGAASGLSLLVTHYLVQPDVDTDGDGLEKLEDTNGDAIVDRCIDGDGTVITGEGCVHDPRIADGFSAALGVGAVRCVLDPPCDPANGPCPMPGHD
jgi:hypothetical protein